MESAVSFSTRMCFVLSDIHVHLNVIVMTLTSFTSLSIFLFPFLHTNLSIFFHPKLSALLVSCIICKQNSPEMVILGVCCDQNFTLKTLQSDLESVSDFVSVFPNGIFAAAAALDPTPLLQTLWSREGWWTALSGTRVEVVGWDARGG